MLERVRVTKKGVGDRLLVVYHGDLASSRPFYVRFEGAGRGPGWKVRHVRLFIVLEEAAQAEVSLMCFLVSCTTGQLFMRRCMICHDGEEHVAAQFPQQELFKT